MRAFVSSTFIDLINYWQSAINALQRLNLDIRHMEVFGAGPNDAMHVSLSAIDECDYFVGIYAHRYGYIPPSNEKSITEQEFDHAYAVRKPVFCFFVDPPSPEDSAKIARCKAVLNHQVDNCDRDMREASALAYILFGLACVTGPYFCPEEFKLLLVAISYAARIHSNCVGETWYNYRQCVA